MGKVLNIDVQPELSGHPMAFKTFKLPVPVKFRIAEAEEVVKTHEGDVPARAGDYIMTSESGKSWPIQPETFKSTYTIEEGLDAGIASKKKIDVYALQLMEPVDVEVSWSNSPIHGNKHDYLVQGGLGDYWVVEYQEFLDTYGV